VLNADSGVSVIGTSHGWNDTTMFPDMSLRVTHMYPFGASMITCLDGAGTIGAGPVYGENGCHCIFIRTSAQRKKRRRKEENKRR
jgi:hypothetical protein